MECRHFCIKKRKESFKEGKADLEKNFGVGPLWKRASTRKLFFGKNPNYKYSIRLKKHSTTSMKKIRQHQPLPFSTICLHLLHPTQNSKDIKESPKIYNQIRGYSCNISKKKKKKKENIPQCLPSLTGFYFALFKIGWHK